MKSFFTAPFVLIGTFFVVAAVASAVIYFKPFELRTIQQRVVEQRNLSAIHDLKGTWEGKTTLNNSNCVCNIALTLVINDQSEKGISGSLINTGGGCTPTRAEGYTCFFTEDTTPISAGIEGTRIVNLKAGIIGIFAGSYTQDTITLNQTIAGAEINAGGKIVVAPVDLLKK